MTCRSGREFASRYVLIPYLVECLIHSRRSPTLNFQSFGLVTISSGSKT